MKDGEKFGLAEIALRFLGIKEKENIVRELCKQYKVKGKAIAKGKLYSVKELPHNPKFKEYALNDLDLTLKVLNLFKTNRSATGNHDLGRNYNLGFNRISPLFFKQGEVSFAGIKVDVKALNQRIKELSDLKDNDLLRYAYKLFGAATGRFTAYVVENKKEAELFIKGEDFHRHLAEKLNIPNPTTTGRDISKSIRHGTRYTRGAKSLARELNYEGLKVTEQDMGTFIRNFWKEQPELKDFVKKTERISSGCTHYLTVE